MTRPLYGGQALLEGVMMRGHRHVAVAVRHPNGHIVTRAEPLPHRLYGGRVSRFPFLRGIVMLWDAMALGYRGLTFSAQVAMNAEQGEDEPEQLPAAEAVRATMLMSLAVAVGLFFVTPMLIAGLLHELTGNVVVTNVVEGIFRLLLLIGYLFLIGNSPRIARVFAYHGAEHKAVHAEEQGVDLAPGAVQACSTAHPRCGTTLLLVVVVLSVALFALLGHPPLWLRILSRVLLAPVLVGLSYEWLRFSAGNFQRMFVRALVWPGLALQSLTTRQPDDGQVEVAIAALRAVITADEKVERVSAAVASETA